MVKMFSDEDLLLMDESNVFIDYNSVMDDEPRVYSGERALIQLVYWVGICHVIIVNQLWTLKNKEQKRKIMRLCEVE